MAKIFLVFEWQIITTRGEKFKYSLNFEGEGVGKNWVLEWQIITTGSKKN